MHFWAVLWHPRRSLISSQIFCQIFLASLLSSRSKFSAQSWTRIFCSSLVHVSYDFLPVLVDSRDSKTVGGDGELDTLSPPIGVKERLVDDDGDGVGELCMLCITGHNNGLLLGASYPKSGERFIGKNGAWNPSEWPDLLSMLSVSMLSLGFRALSLKVSLCIFVSLPAPPIHFWSSGEFFENLHEGVALGKTPMLTQFLVKQTEFALVRPMPSTEMFSASLSMKLWMSLCSSVCMWQLTRLAESNHSTGEYHVQELVELVYSSP